MPLAMAGRIARVLGFVEAASEFWVGVAVGSWIGASEEDVMVLEADANVEVEDGRACATAVLCGRTLEGAAEAEIVESNIGITVADFATAVVGPSSVAGG